MGVRMGEGNIEGKLGGRGLGCRGLGGGVWMGCGGKRGLGKGMGLGRDEMGWEGVGERR